MAKEVMRHDYSLAHKLGHIVLHHGRHGIDSWLKRQTGLFVAELPTPREVVVNERSRRGNLNRYEQISQRSGISVASQFYRARELDLFSESTVHRGYSTLISLPQRPMPTSDFLGERPELLKSAIDLLKGTATSLAMIAADL